MKMADGMKLSLLIFTALMLSIMLSAVTVFADISDRFLEIDGVRVTEENAANIPVESGKASYDTETNTLTLENAVINIKGNFNNFGIHMNNDGVNIVLKGANTIQSSQQGGDGYGITTASFLNISGDGSLDIKVDSRYSGGAGIRAGNVSVENADVNIDSINDGIEAENLTLSAGADININAICYGVKLTRDGVLTIGDGAVLEAFSRGADQTALYGVDPDEGDLKTVKAFVGKSANDLEPVPWIGDTEESKLTSYKFVRFPYAETALANVTFDRNGGEGSLDPMQVFKGRQITLPQCTFTKTGESFDCWKIGDKTYYPGDKVTITEDTTVTAEWTEWKMDLYIGGVQVNANNNADVLKDGHISVTKDDENREIVIALNNASVKAAACTDGTDPDTLYGVRYDESGYDLKFSLTGENKIFSEFAEDDITRTVGIDIRQSVGHPSYNVTFTGEGSLTNNIPINKHRATYIGIESTQATVIDGTDVQILMPSSVSDLFVTVKGYFNVGSNALTVKNNSKLSIDTGHTYCFDSNKNDNVDLIVETGSTFEAHASFGAKGADGTDSTSAPSWRTVHGNGWVKFSEETISQEIMVKTSSSEKYTAWNRDYDKDLQWRSYLFIHDHEWDAGVVAKEPTLKAEGEKLYTCSDCEGTRIDPMAKLKRNTLTVKPKTGVVRYSRLKKRTQTLARKKVLTVKKPQGAVTYKRVKGNKKISINKKTGKVTIKKKLKKGTYKITVKVTAAGTKYKYAPKTKKVTFKVRVK